jgi:hypothetical protein
MATPPTVLPCGRGRPVTLFASHMLFNAPGAKLSDGLPAMVTRYGFTGCLNCRWLPLVATWIQPSSPISSIASRTFTRGGFLAPPRAVSSLY